MRQIVVWFACNSVAANLLMWVLIVMGLVAVFTINQQNLPNMDLEIVNVTVPYLGAAPEDVEQGVCVRVEEAVRGTAGIKKITSTAVEGSCGVTIELTEDSYPVEVLNEIKSQVDGINTFPLEAEKPTVSKFAIRHGVIELVFYGDVGEQALKELGKQVRDEVAALPGISQVRLNYVRPYEISVEVPENTLRRHGLTLEQVRDAIRRTSLDMPGGTIKTMGGDVLLRTDGQAYQGEEFENIVVLTHSDGTQVSLGEIATVIDGFAEGDLRARFNGVPAVVVKVERVGDEDLIAIADKTKAYLEDLRPRLPQGIEVATWWDESNVLRDRVNNLTSTAALGMFLVVLILALFLRFRLAMWVAAGIPIAMLGAVGMFLFGDNHISMLTIMAFILVLGIVVDDAIVVGERIYAHEQMGKSPIDAAIEGTWEVSVPVIFGVLTTMAAFLPLVISSGRLTEVFGTIAWVVIYSLVFSIVESQMILPAHLARRSREKNQGAMGKYWARLQDGLSAWLVRVAEVRYQPLLRRALTFRYITVTIGIAALILVFGMIGSGRITFSFFPPLEGDIVFATLEMPAGVSIESTSKAVRQLERSAEVLRSELDRDLDAGEPSRVNNFLTLIGMHLNKGDFAGAEEAGKSHLAEVALELIPLHQRNGLSAVDVADRWRELNGSIADAVSLTFSSTIFTTGNALEFEVSGQDVDQMRQVAAKIRSELSRFDGVYDISDSFRSGKQEIKLSLLPQASNWGINLSDLAQQVRSAFYGAEAQRIQRGRDEVRVMVRYPEVERQSIGNLENMRIRTASGLEVPFSSVARFEIERGYSTINRIDGQRVVSVYADVARETANPVEIMASMMEEAIPEILQSHPGVKVSLAGEQEERKKAMTDLSLGALLSMLIIYALLAIPLRSYLQPLVIMSVIPFGAIGAILGHYIMGVQLMFFSMLGIVALSGVVVNASLVLVDYINRERRKGVELIAAVSLAGVVRFRPIILTSSTTFFGLLPLLITADPSTAMIIPMAVSLAFGIVFATVMTLVFVPCLYLIAEDFFPWGEMRKDPALDEVDAELLSGA